MRLGPEGQGENSFSGFKTPAIVKARECLNKEVGEGCPGEESQLKDCQERNCPGGWMGWARRYNSNLIEKGRPDHQTDLDLD